MTAATPTPRPIANTCRTQDTSRCTNVYTFHAPTAPTAYAVEHLKMPGILVIQSLLLQARPTGPDRLSCSWQLLHVQVLLVPQRVQKCHRCCAHHEFLLLVHDKVEVRSRAGVNKCRQGPAHQHSSSTKSSDKVLDAALRSEQAKHAASVPAAAMQ
jgi:hypothetical protein